MVTHHFDSDQRYIELAFDAHVDSEGNAVITATSPSENLAPPGYYMIFVNEAPSSSSPRSAWAPSTGQFVRLQ